MKLLQWQICLTNITTNTIRKRYVNTIKNFICDNCDHYLVCEKLKPLMKFHDSAKKDLLITLTMEDCADYAPDADSKGKESEDTE